MTDPTVEPDVPGTVIPALEQLLREQWHDRELAVASAEPFGDGHSGFTYLLRLAGSRAGEDYVIRMSPPGARIAGNADVGRQGRIMSTLHGSGFPVPRVLLSDSSGAVDGRALAVMERVHGMDWRAAAERHDAAWVSTAAVDTLRTLRSLPLATLELTGEAPSTPAEDLGRWARLFDRAADGVQTADGRSLLAELAATPPADVPPALVHGDYHYGNLLFGPDGVLAVVDWEVAGLGDPRWDLGSLAVATIRRRYRDEPNPTGDLAVSLESLADEYGPAQDLEWFVAASCVKYAAILGYNLGLHRRGRRHEPIYEQLVGTIRGLPTEGLAVLANGWGAGD